MALFSFLNKKNSTGEKNFTQERDRLQLVDEIVKKRKMLIELKQLTQQLAQKEIADWRTANQLAIDVENPNRYQLYQIFYDAMLDDHLLGAVRNRKLKVMRTRFKIIDQEGKENPELTRLLQKRWFKKFMSLSLDAIFYGHSLIELGDIVRGDAELKFKDIELIPRPHVKPEFHVIVKEVMDEPKNGFDYAKPPFSDWAISVGEPKDLGLLLPVAKDTISKKYALQFWDQFAEIFGMPVRIGKSSSRNKSDLDRVERMLEDMGSAAWGLFPEGTEIEVVESKNSGTAFNVYDKRVERANSEISKAILGQTMTMDNGSSKSQAEVHEGVAEDIAEADADWLHDVINDDLFPVLIKHGFPLAGFRFQWDDTYEYSADEMRQIEEMLLSEYDIDPNYFIEKYGVAITGKKQLTAPSVPVEGEKKKLSLFKVTRPVFPKPCCEDYTITLAAASVDTTGKELIRFVWDNRDAVFNANYYNWLSKVYIDALARGWNGDKALKLAHFKNTAEIVTDFNSPDHLAMNLMELNLFRFSAAKSAAAVTELNKLAREHDNFNDFRKAAEKVTGLYNETFLRTEYNFAWNTAHTSADYYRMMNQKEQFPTWQYMTVGDARVRDAHKALHGKKFKAGEMDSVYPPNGWNCRCWVKPLQGKPDKFTTEKEAQEILAKEGIDKHGNSEWDRMIKGRFNVNRAKTREIYDEDKFYIKENLEQKLSFKSYGLKYFNELNKLPLPKAKLSNITVKEAKQYIKETEFVDYNKRIMQLTEKTLNSHSTKEYLETIKLIPEIINTPDELYFYEEGRNKTLKLRYIKYYDDKPMNLIVDIDNETGFKILTWFEMNPDKVDTFRNGILIHKK